ncbi:MAG TPA: SDR family NAD(P)-dependent oxidoreductase [Bryobacteraceae bacterium]|nr:SDR family NAD(P)-dependent oxidoreductase [Bryobacteraceae bacterium]
MESLTEQVTLITGVTGGLGRAVAKAFLEAGATVVGVSPDMAAPGENARFLPLAADVSTPGGAAQAMQGALARTGRVDALIHLVGGFAGGQNVAETSDETWLHMLDLNLNTAFYAARAVLPHMLAARRGRIVAVGSRAGVEPAAGLSAYGVSKAALIALVRTIAAEVRDSGVTANVVLPSVIDTPANRSASPGADASKWVKPESIAALLVWLASGAAADVNGAVIPIYGRA